MTCDVSPVAMFEHGFQLCLKKTQLANDGFFEHGFQLCIKKTQLANDGFPNLLWF